VQEISSKSSPSYTWALSAVVIHAIFSCPGVFGVAQWSSLWLVGTTKRALLKLIKFKREARGWCACVIPFSWQILTKFTSYILLATVNNVFSYEFTNQCILVAFHMSDTYFPSWHVSCINPLPPSLINWGKGILVKLIFFWDWAKLYLSDIVPCSICG